MFNRRLRCIDNAYQSYLFMYITTERQASNIHGNSLMFQTVFRLEYVMKEISLDLS